MWSTSRNSASSSIVVPAFACSCSRDRTASAISCRPPYPTAMLTASPRRSTVRSAAALSTCAVSGGSRSSEPTSVIRQPSRAVASSVTSSSMIRSSGCSSDSGRDRLSVDSSHRVTTSTPASALQRSTSSILSAPAWWPKLTSPAPAARAQRRLPSHMTPTCLGTGRPASWRRNRRSYATYSRSCTATRALYAGAVAGSRRSGQPDVTKTAPESGGSPHAAAQPSSVISAA
jgi:hypothetical protein